MIFNSPPAAASQTPFFTPALQVRAHVLAPPAVAPMAPGSPTRPAALSPAYVAAHLVPTAPPPGLFSLLRWPIGSTGRRTNAVAPCASPRAALFAALCFTDPVICLNGRAYERGAVPRAQKNSPIVPCIALRQVAQEWAHYGVISDAFLARCEQHLVCPITQERFEEPVTCADGVTYEKKAIEAWLASHEHSPATRASLLNAPRIVNQSLRDLIAALWPLEMLMTVRAEVPPCHWLRTLTHAAPITSVAALGDIAAFGSIDGTIHIWNHRTGVAARTLENAHSCAQTPRSDPALDNRSALPQSRSICGDPRDGGVRGLAFRGKNLLSVGGQGKNSYQSYSIKTWTTSGKRRGQLPKSAQTLLHPQTCICAEGQAIAVYHDAYTIQYHESPHSSCIGLATLPHSRHVGLDSNEERPLAMHGKIVAATANLNIQLYDFDAPYAARQIAHFQGHTGTVRSLAMQANTLASGGDDKTIRLWNIAARRPEKTLIGHQASVTALALRRSLLISGDRDGSIMLWNCDNGVVLGSLTGHCGAITSLAIAGDTIICGAADQRVSQWRLEPGAAALAGA